MKKQLKTFSVKKMNILSVAMALICLAAALPLNLLVFHGSLRDHAVISMVAMFVGYIILIIAHEAIHALAALIFTKAKPKDIEFGAIWAQLMFYCHVKKPMTAREYRAVLIMPLIFTGILPLIAVTVWGNPYLVLLFSLLVSGAAGDVVMFRETLRYPKTQLIEDHPKAPAYYLLFEEGAELPPDFKEVTDEQEQELLDMMNRKK